MGLAMTILVSVVVLAVFSPIIVKRSEGSGVRGAGVVQNMIKSKVDKAYSLASSHGVDLPETSGYSDSHIEPQQHAGKNSDAKIAVSTLPSLSVVGRNEAVEKEMLEGIEAIRAIKGQKRVIETDPEAQAKIPEVQELIRTFLINKYGPPPYILRMDITLPAYLEAPYGSGQKAERTAEDDTELSDGAERDGGHGSFP